MPEATRQHRARGTGATDRPRPTSQLTDRLAQDLGLDSLASAELAIWIEKEFGFSVGTPESLTTVGDVVLAASGKGISAIESALQRRQRRLVGAIAAPARSRFRRAPRSRRCS